MAAIPTSDILPTRRFRGGDGMQSLMYLNPFKGRELECRDLVLTCIDFRFRRQLEHMMFRMGCQEFDLLAIQGGSKAVTDESSRQTVLDAIKIAVERHHVNHIMVLDHVDCGAYGGSIEFNLPEDEVLFHVSALNKAEKIIRAAFPDVQVSIGYVDWEKLQVF